MGQPSGPTPREEQARLCEAAQKQAFEPLIPALLEFINHYMQVRFGGRKVKCPNCGLTMRAVFHFNVQHPDETGVVAALGGPERWN